MDDYYMMNFTDISTEDLLLFIEEIFDMKMLVKEVFELVEKEKGLKQFKD